MLASGAGKAPDLQYWEKTARTIVDASRGNKIVVEKSTLPVRTAHAMERILKSNRRGIRFEVLSNPEFLSEGTAVRDRSASHSRRTRTPPCVGPRPSPS